jgi:hypothetical protein
VQRAGRWGKPCMWHPGTIVSGSRAIACPMDEGVRGSCGRARFERWRARRAVSVDRIVLNRDVAGDAALAVRDDEEMLEANLGFYDPLWKQSRLASPERFNTWPLVRSLLAPSQSRLEVGPGLRPRLPLEGTSFIDASLPAVTKLRSHGARAEIGVVSRLPFANGTFDLVAAFDIVEHVDDDDAALAELARVAAPGATVLLSVPLQPRAMDGVRRARRAPPSLRA